MEKKKAVFESTLGFFGRSACLPSSLLLYQLQWWQPCPSVGSAPSRRSLVNVPFFKKF
jgi:hypothetical protein